MSKESQAKDWGVLVVQISFFQDLVEGFIRKVSLVQVPDGRLLPFLPRVA